MVLPSGSGHVSAYLDEILLAIVAQIINQVPKQNEETCYLTNNLDEVPSPNPGEVCIAIMLRPGRFDDSMLDGSIDQQATWEGGVDVRIHAFTQLDQVGRDGIAMTDSALGLLKQATYVIKALGGFAPKDENGNPMLREPMQPADTNADRHPRDVTTFDVGFSLTFDWNLGATP